MRNLIPVLLVLASFLANCDVSNSINTPRESNHVARLKQVNESSNVNEHRHKHRKSRCRRDISGGFVGTYQQNRQGHWVYRDPVYVPSRCNNYCPYCPLASCRRRCPPPVFPPHVGPQSRPTPRWSTPKINGTTSNAITSASTRAVTTSPRAITTNPPEPITTNVSSASTNPQISTTTNSPLPDTEDDIEVPPAQLVSCTCDPDGSKFHMCNVKNGSCVCNPHYKGQHCDTCEDGYWKNNRKCEKCKCNKDGSLHNNCNQETGMCHCRPGITGRHCDACLPDHYGTIKTGCKKCDTCHKEGHICDPHNGKCVCPPLTTGIACESCSTNSFGYEPGIGCKACDCSETGSANPQCDNIGRCSCKPGYEGEKCNRCSYGYYGYPHCRKCNCILEGTLEEECKEGECRCNDEGYCKCKENVQGRDCGQCKNNNYGLTKENPKGCTTCFCFGRSNQCEDAQYHWNKTRLDRIDRDDDEIDQDVLELPREFLGDLTSSYGGYLNIQVPEGKFDVYLRGNGVILNSTDNINYLQMVETSKWRISSGNEHFPNSCIDSLTRACFMVVLEKVTSIQVRARKRIREVLLDRAGDKESYAITHSIEKCKCPDEYSGLSCQNPNKGYFRHFSGASSTNWIDPIIGIAKACECGGHSNECDPERGICQNCTDHTTGDHCEECDVGFYLDKHKTCSACLCPSAEQNNARSCSPTEDGFICQCRAGYKGKYCDECEKNYYKPPGSQTCQPCECNLFGTDDSKSCDQYGNCHCKMGFKGTKCDECVDDRKYIENGECRTCDECTLKLFNEIDNMEIDFEGIFDSFKNGIGPPWKKLTEDIGKLDGLSKIFYDEKEKIEALLEKDNIDIFENKISEMEDILNKNNELAKDNIDRTDEIYKNSTTLLKESGEQSKKLTGLINSLINFDTKQVDLKEALKRAKLILKEMQDESKKLKQLDGHVYAQCEAVNKKVENLYKPFSDASDEKLKELKRKLQDLINIVSFVDNLTQLADSKNTENSRRFEKIKENIEILKSKNKNIQTSLGDIVNKTEAIEDIMNQLSLVYEDLKEISQFNEFNELENRVKRQMEDIPKIEQLYARVIEHVQELDNKINRYQNMFNFTKDEWKRINASGAYEAIINGIKQTRESIKESENILKKAIEIISPENSDSLDAKTNLAHAYSDRLKQRINNLKNISKNLADIRNKLDNLKYIVVEKGKSNNNLTQILIKIDQNIGSFNKTDLEKAKANSTRISEAMRVIEKQLEDLNFEQQFFLAKNLEKYRAEMAPKEKEYFDAKLKDIRTILANLNISTPSINGNKIQSNKVKNLEINITNLQNRIMEAKQQVDRIDVAMNLFNCTMTYKITKPEYFRSLSIKFRCENCVLFSWKKSTSVKLALSIENSKLVLHVDENEVYLKNNSTEEQTIKLEKIGTRIEVQMGNETKSTEISDVFKIDENDTLEVGSMEKTALNAYISKIVLNNKEFGIWKFKTTNGNCSGVRRKASNGKVVTRHFFNGEGYMHYQMEGNKPDKITLKMDIETFDENSTIFVTEYRNTVGNTFSFIYLYLLQGGVHLSVLHDNGQSFNIDSCPIKINDAKKHVIELNLNFKSEKQYYDLKVDSELCSESGSKSLKKKHIFRIKPSKHYIGGVPPTFNKSTIPVKTKSLLGILNLRTVGQIHISHGISEIDEKALELKSAMVDPNGYINIEIPKKQLKILQFSLKPYTDGIVMKFDDDLNISYQRSELFINGVKHSYHPSTDYTYIELRLGKKAKLIIDGEKMDVGNIKELNIANIRIGDQKDGFSGGIRDILINHELLTFNANSVKNFSKVEIGRDKPPIEAAITVRSLTMMNSMQNTEGCVDFDNYNTETDAVKYGDKPNSFTHMKTNFWKKNHTLQFDFRTLSSDGVLLISSNKKMKYILLGLRKGQLYLTMKGGKKKMTSYQKVDDGQWHNLRIVRTLKKLLIVLDGEKQLKGVNFRMRLNDEIYFGGVPSNSEYRMVNDLFDKLQPFRGCIRNLSIDDERKFLIKNSKEIKHSGITQCFSNVEEGAYFGGDAYAIYRDDFRIREPVKLSFEFRTSEQNGVLLSISNGSDSPALSVELQNGAIVMAVDNGNGIISNVTNNLGSDFSLCNNRWHNVTALYSNSELTVNVDGIRKSWVVSDQNSTIEQLEAPLYIGGTPVNTYNRTLKSLTNFKGCVRKLTIQNQIVDWSSMNTINNVLLNSCPINQS